MRIISGQFKGKKILDPKDKNTRPLKDLTKESIFNIIHHSNKIFFKLQNSNVLDLFSGVGSFGLEALSRNAGSVTFVENYFNVIKVLKKNIENLELKQKCKVIEKDVFYDLNFAKLNQEYDLIFLDPPFKENKIRELMENLNKSNILDKEGMIILHRNKKYKDQLPQKFKIELEKTYGSSKIIFGSF